MPPPVDHHRYRDRLRPGVVHLHRHRDGRAAGEVRGAHGTVGPGHLGPHPGRQALAQQRPAHLRLIDVGAGRLEPLVMGDGLEAVGPRQRRRQQPVPALTQQRLDDRPAARGAGEGHQQHRVRERGEVGEGAGSTIDHHGDHRPCAGGARRTHHVELRLGQRDRGEVHALAVGGVRGGPVGRPVLRELVVVGAAAGAAQHHHRGLGPGRRGGDLRERRLTARRAQVAAAGVRHRVRPEPLDQRGAHRRGAGLLGRARRGVVAQQRVEIIGVGADGRDAAGAQRQVPAVLQHDHGLAGGALGEHRRLPRPG